MKFIRALITVLLALMLWAPVAWAAVTVSDLGELVHSKKLSFAYQFTSGGKEYMVARYGAFDVGVVNTDILVVWNLTDETVQTVTLTGAAGAECYPVPFSIDLLSSGKLASVNTKYYYEIDLVNGTAFTHILACNALSNPGGWVVQGHTGHVIMSSGTQAGGRWIEWCDQGGANWGTKAIATSIADGKLMCPASMTGTDTFNYAYATVKTKNYVVAVRMDTGGETAIDMGSSIANMIQVTDGTVAVLMSNGTWYGLDGIETPQLITAPTYPTDYYHRQQDSTSAITTSWFTSAVIAVDKTNIMPNDDDEVSISYSGSAPETTTATVARYAINTRLLSEPDSDGNARLMGANYGPHCYFYPATDTLGTFKSDYQNAYSMRWSPNHQLWWFTGYTRKLSYYNPASPWTTSVGSDTPTTDNPTYNQNDDWTSDDRFIFPVWETVNIDKIFFYGKDTGALYWYNITDDTFSVVSLVTVFGLNSSIVTDIKSILGGHFIAIASSDQDVAEGARVGRLRLYHVPSGTFTKTLTIDAAVDNIGKLIEVGSSDGDLGHLIAIRGNAATGCEAWRINTFEVDSAAVVWNTAITGNVFKLSTSGMVNEWGWAGEASEYSYIEVGPDGLVYFYLDTSIYSINPATGGLVEEVTAGAGAPAPPQCLRWLGNTLYTFGGNNKTKTHIYKITGLN